MLSVLHAQSTTLPDARFSLKAQLYKVDVISRIHSQVAAHVLISVLRTWPQVTISLLEEAMLKGGKQQVLIDGFPRNEENRAAFEAQVALP